MFRARTAPTCLSQINLIQRLLQQTASKHVREAAKMQSEIKDVLVVLDSYPRAVDKRIIDSAIRLAKRSNCHLSALSFDVAFKVRTSSILHRFGLDSSVLQLVAREQQTSRSNAAALLHAFEVAAKDADGDGTAAWTPASRSRPPLPAAESRP